ncbi:energy-coupling factor transporter ATPase [Spiroplasma platyhelix]|uniref:Energy-coupling factor transporter ATP-binding protein EcfA2 n=1 Tax=Spiroplasma platyhelix PALS-1 TaxID=1276218 RepID=A0A846U9Z2_9MOLU|nr:energy-coupling factor transporter ATPase [Spiroplasma platyhelix]MBE4704311.1 Energy-coupling factor transporter ATP-binding protein EcfA2 [Spiroplasma platyhelix PALS-1]NKE38683.1 energy-coupling factor transporter ATPase [Spiroplasma platyhelix PALS-1]UJB28895.1 cobalt ABC transporter ATP-binding subunit [Spiroplasma platyhelix PALS-1]
MPIRFKEVSYIYSPKTPYQYQALDKVSVEISDHKIIAIIGETGSGKSTLIQHINGLLIPMNGEVAINDFVIKANKKKIRDIKQIRKQIGLVFQFPEYQLFEETIEKDIMFGPVNFGATKEAAKKLASKYINVVGMDDSYLPRSPFDLSGGQKRRVAIAGILALQGHTLILDEPTAGLDPDGEKELLKLFYNLNKEENKTIILVTHNMNHVLEVADEVIVLHNTKILTKADPITIFKNQDLIAETGIEPPKVYSFIYKLQQAGFDTSSLTARSTKELIEQLAAILKEKKNES